MTRRGKIREFFNVLSEYLGIEFVRGDQSGERPDYPFLSYKILSINGGSAQEVIKTQESIDDKVKNTSVRESKLVISLNFFAEESDYENLSEIAEKAYAWIDSLDGLEAADEIGIGVSVVNYIQDRTIFLETEYEYRLGFDIEIRDKAITTDVVDTINLETIIEDIKIQGEING